MDYSLEDLRPLKEETIEKRIAKSLNLARLVLYINYRFENSNPSSITIGEISNYFQIDYRYAAEMMVKVVGMGLVRKIKQRGEKAVKFVPLKEVNNYVKVAEKKVFEKENI